MALMIAKLSAFLLSMAGASIALGAAATPPSAADELFARGDFTGAAAAYAREAAAQPSDPGAMLGLARTRLYENHLDAASAYAAALLALDPGDATAKALRATIERRRRILDSAATLQLPASGVVLPFVESEPLPAIRMSVDGKAGTFLIDTGGSDVTLDPEFAKEAGLTITGGHQGTFLGGRTAEVREAVAGRIEAGPVRLTGVGVTILPSRGLRLYPDRIVDGVVGTVFLSRFLSTLDYPHRRLVLRNRSASLPENPQRRLVPMWWVGDHFIFAQGSVNDLGQQLFNVDSGGAGVGFMPAAATVEAAHVKTFPKDAFQGMGGGGSVTVVPTVADRVCLGTVCESDVKGGYTPGGSPLSIFPFAASGTVSHAFLEKYAVTFDFARMELSFE